MSMNSMARPARLAAGGMLLVMGGAPALPAQSAARPFTVGEKLTYDVRFGPLKVGSGALELRGIEPVRGEDAYHAVFRIRGGTAFYKVDDTFESWFATDDLSSLRFHQDQNEGSKEREKRYEIFPERRTYGMDGAKGAEQASSANPLDDASFLYFLRTVPLEVGKTYTFNRYFKPDRNPITIRVVRKERVTVPAGTFDAVVLQPTIKTKGIFSEGGQAEVWLSDDDRRVLLQLKSKLTFGSLNLYLTSSNRALASVVKR
jgi:hypothetical protein